MIAELATRQSRGAAQPYDGRAHRSSKQANHLPDAIAALDLRLTDEEVQIVESSVDVGLPTGN